MESWVIALFVFIGGALLVFIVVKLLLIRCDKSLVSTKKEKPPKRCKHEGYNRNAHTACPTCGRVFSK